MMTLRYRLNKEPNVQECDATDVDSSNVAWLIIIFKSFDAAVGFVPPKAGLQTCTSPIGHTADVRAAMDGFEPSLLVYETTTYPLDHMADVKGIPKP